MTDRASSFNGLRVAVIGPFPPRPGELSDQTELLCRLLHAEGAWVQRVNTDVPGVRRLPRIGIHLLPIAQVLALCWRLLVALPRSDVLHVQAASYWGFFLPVGMALLFGKLGRRRVVISYSGGMTRSFVTRSWRLVLPLLRRADGLATTSAYGQEILQRYGLRALVVPNLLALEEHPLLARTSWPPLLLWLDELEPRANPQMALHALALLRQSVPEARLMLAGSGSLAEEVVTLARTLGIAEAVAYRPALTERQRQDAIREASVVWRTASEDSLPQLLLEAAASGTAIVATAVGGIPELLDDGVDGLLVLPEDATALAQATARVLSRPFLAKSLAANARIAVERFTWRRQRANLARLYGLAPAAANSDSKEPDDEAASEAHDDLPSRTEFLWSDPGRGPDAG
ncbi:MAG TPA: glycosyltransferase family 4 protein [Anaerolineae bacterium]|nr:glycosyltransferase family 4 protein [Anaerolineae bacterium]